MQVVVPSGGLAGKFRPKINPRSAKLILKLNKLINSCVTHLSYSVIHRPSKIDLSIMVNKKNTQKQSTKLKWKSIDAINIFVDHLELHRRHHNRHRRRRMIRKSLKRLFSNQNKNLIQNYTTINKYLPHTCGDIFQKKSWNKSSLYLSACDFM